MNRNKSMCVKNTYSTLSILSDIGEVGDINVRILIDYVLVQKIILRQVNDVKTVRRLRGEVPDYESIIILCKIRLVKSYMKRKTSGNVGEIIKEKRLLG